MKNDTWWGRATLRLNTAAVWYIGSLELMIERSESNWIISYRHSNRRSSFEHRTLASLAESHRLKSAPAPASSMSPFFSADFKSRAFVAGSPAEELLFSPILPARPLAIHFPEPRRLEPNEKLTLNLRLPMEIQIDATNTNAANRNLLEVPIEALSKTWYGPSPLHGEVALAAFDSGSASATRPIVVDSFAGLQPRLDQAGTIAIIKNSSATAKDLERILIPCGRLSLFHSSQTGFWTDTMTVDLRENAVEAHLTERSLPKEAGQAQFVAHPHHQSSAGRSLENGFNTIAGLFRERG